MPNDGREQNPDEEFIDVREIHPLNSPLPSASTSSTSSIGRRREAVSISSSQSIGSETEGFTTLSREFNALVVAGSSAQTTDDEVAGGNENLERIREEELIEETNPLAIVPDNNPISSPRTQRTNTSVNTYSPPSLSSFNDNSINYNSQDFSVQKVKKEETVSKISAWQTAEIAKINNRFKRQDVIISGWECEQVEKANTRLKKVERKLEEQRAKAIEKMQNDVAKARRKAEEKRASAEAKRGTKVAKVLQLSNFLRAVGRAPSKRSFF